MKKPTKAEIEAVSASPRRFRRCLEQADEVRVHAALHGGWQRNLLNTQG